MNRDDILIKIVGILLILACLKILIADAKEEHTHTVCPICVEELPSANEMRCREMYVTEEDMGECLWLLENQPALQ